MPLNRLDVELSNDGDEDGGNDDDVTTIAGGELSRFL